MAISEKPKASSQPPLEIDGPHHKKAAFLAGLMAGMVMTAVMVILLLTGVTARSIGNFVSDRLAALAGPQVTEFFIQTIGPLGKDMLFLFVLIGQALVGGLLGIGFAVVTGKTTSRATVWRNSFILSTGFWLVFMVVLFPILNVGVFGAGLGNDQTATLVISFLLFALFGLTFGYAYLFLVPTAKELSIVEVKEAEAEGKATAKINEPAQVVEVAHQLQTHRRTFVGVISGLFVLIIGATLGVRAVSVPAGGKAVLGDTPIDTELHSTTPIQGEVTATDAFYQVSKNTFNPRVDAASWHLEIKGLVNKPATYTFDDLTKMSQTSVYETLTCISNPVGGGIIGNAKWTGMPIHTLIEQAGVGQHVQRAVFTCADGYQDSVTIQKLLEPNTFLAFQMNDAPLTIDHGYPARMLIPDIYGMKNAKWITSITLIDSDFEGFWQTQGWDNAAQIHLESIIVAPADTSSVPAGQKTTVKGVAFAGSRDIEKVELSFDAGKTWTAATIKDRLGSNAWTLWYYDWTPLVGQAKTYILQARSTEAGGKLQNPQKLDPFPAGSSGYHTISVSVM